EYQILTEENHTLLAGYMQSNGLKNLIIVSDEDGKGWNKDYLPSLKPFEFIEELLIYWTNIKDIKEVEVCINIKRLVLDNDDKTEIDFTKFQNLEELVSWERKKIDTVW